MMLYFFIQTNNQWLLGKLKHCGRIAILKFFYLIFFFIWITSPQQINFLQIRDIPVILVKSIETYFSPSLSSSSYPVRPWLFSQTWKFRAKSQSVFLHIFQSIMYQNRMEMSKDAIDLQLIGFWYAFQRYDNRGEMETLLSNLNHSYPTKVNYQGQPKIT